MTNTQAHTLQDAAALYREGRLEEAGAICAALLRITPGDLDARHLQGLIAFQAKDFQRAADVIGAALEITPHPLAYNNRGAALLELQQTAQALECFDKALAQALPDGFEYIALQKDVSDADQAALKSRADIRTFGAALEDFADTAALCELVDVIVSVDTSTVHLAGALARPVWALLPVQSRLALAAGENR